MYNIFLCYRLRLKRTQNAHTSLEISPVWPLKKANVSESQTQQYHAVACLEGKLIMLISESPRKACPGGKVNTWMNASVWGVGPVHWCYNHLYTYIIYRAYPIIPYFWFKFWLGWISLNLIISAASIWNPCSPVGHENHHPRLTRLIFTTRTCREGHPPWIGTTMPEITTRHSQTSSRRGTSYENTSHY